MGRASRHSPGAPTLTLTQFLVLARQDVTDFEAMWLQGVKETPEHFPEDMPSAEWYEQFIVNTGL